MPLTIVVADDTPDYRQIVRYVIATVADSMTIVGEAADTLQQARHEECSLARAKLPLDA